MKKKLKFLNSLTFTLLLHPIFTSAQVFTNQAGYLSNTTKLFYTSTSADSFYVIDKSNGSIAFKDELSFFPINDPATGLNLYSGEFTSLETNGNYFILLSSGDSSYAFKISQNVFEEPFYKSLKGYYFQRCGVALLQGNAGAYFHNPCHQGDGFYHSSTGQSGFRIASGGWHDAGDYGKYVINSGITVGTLLLAYQNFPERFSNDNLNIPESGNGIPDLLDEVRYELEWLLKMQNSNGGVYFKVTKEQFESFIMPQNDSGIRYIYELSSTATGNFAAMMAQAARVYQQYDSDFANQCLNAAILAWDFLTANPTIVPAGGFTNPNGTVTGEYGDVNDSDERFWAAAELFETTGLSTYNDYIIANYSSLGLVTGAMSWQNVKNLGYLTYLNSSQSSSSQTIKDQIENSLISYCNTLLNRAGTNGFGVTINPGEYYWGCNSDVLNKALLLINGYEHTNNLAYYEIALIQLNYMLGSNAHNLSFVTGVGTNSVMHPHHRPSESDGVVDPVPGLLAGGPDQYLDDAVLQAHFNSSTPPALCYIDDVGSYASNEIAINWNAPLVYVLGFFNGERLTSIDNQEFNSLPEIFELQQNYPNPFNPDTKIRYLIPLVTKQNSPSLINVTLKVYDILGKEIVTLVNEEQSSGIYEVEFNNNTVSSIIPSGVYVYRLIAGDYSSSKKMLLLK
jgi:endoglucanase